MSQLPSSNSLSQTSPFRPAPTRAATLGAGTFYKSRATSQPAGERAPAPASLGGSQPDSGRGSPAGMFGVIGGSRTPSKHGGNLAGGIATRANSFSGGEMREPRNNLTRTLSSHIEEHPSRSQSTSPFPTFSPSSTPSTSPSHLPVPLHSPPKAGANVSRSRSQSLAVGVRPIGVGRGGLGNSAWPMSTLDSANAFSRSFDPGWNDPVDGSNMSPFSRNVPSFGAGQGGRFGAPATGGYPTRGYSSGAWGVSAQLSSSVARAFGQPAFSTLVGGFGESGHGANGGKSGSSSRRHSVSVVGGPGGRRDLFAEGMGFGMTSPPGRGLGPLGFSDEELLPERLGNALSLEIDESRKRGVEIEVGKGKDFTVSSSLPRFDSPTEMRGRGVPVFASSPAQGRGGLPEDIRPGSQTSRFNFEQARNNGVTMPGPGRGREVGPPGGFGGPGPIGAPPAFDNGYNGYNNMYRGPPPFQPGRQGPPSPIITNQPQYGRPGYAPFGNVTRPPPQQPFSPPEYGQPQNFPSQQGGQYYPQGSPPQPTSPSFSSLSLSDLGRGLPLASLPPTTPLYIVAFKAGRRDVFYCPDPTSLISNGDRVIVEADRGSDLGTVVYDQLTPVDVREWQEKQATAALLSGAREHQPPGMAVAGVQNKPNAPRVSGGELAGLDLATLLAGVGSNQLDGPLGNTGQGRGPLAKEIMPKRIFTKSSQGPEDQARMVEKLRDEHEAMLICREKAAQRGLPMQIVDAEYQWDRRKLTFYFKADKRIDFRDLTKENFRIFKSRIWMAMVPKDDPRTGFE